MKFKSRVEVSLKPGLSDPEGETTRNALVDLGYDVEKVSVRKVYDIVFEADSSEEAERIVGEICNRLLANPTKDDYEFKVSRLRP